MNDEIIKRDPNHVTTLAGVTNDANLSVTMLRVDPISKRLLVASTGGSGGITEIPIIGTVDGSNITYTATSIPTYLVVDGAWYKKLDNNGIVQWSSSGLIITTNITPINSIFGIA